MAKRNRSRRNPTTSIAATNPKNRRRRSRRNPMANGPRATIALGVMTMVGSAGYALYKKFHVPKSLRNCGRKYQHLVVTSGGLTIEHPYSWPATFGDYEEWKELARRLKDEAQERWALLGTTECEASGGTNCGSDSAKSPNWERYNALVELNNRLYLRFEGLPAFFTSDTPASIAQAQAVIADALCLMQRSDEGITHYGGSIPDSTTIAPDQHPMPWYVWSGLAGGALTAIGVVMSGIIKPESPTVVVSRNP